MALWGQLSSAVRSAVLTFTSRGVTPPVLAVGVCGSEGVALPLARPLARGLPTTLSATAAVTAAACRLAASSRACCLFSAYISRSYAMIRATSSKGCSIASAPQHQVLQCLSTFHAAAAADIADLQASCSTSPQTMQKGWSSATHVIISR